jgi:hypothetical protein
MTLNQAGLVEVRKLVSLDEHNAEAAEAYRQLGQPCLNGIACPSCGKELYDSSPAITWPTAPPSKSIHCSCGYKGTAFK